VAPHLERLETPILYTGHSLGAALATLAASLRPPETLYTFGSPAVGDAGFAATLEGAAIYRYVNCCDIVCRLPPGFYGQIGQLRYIDRIGRIAAAEESEAERTEARLAHFRRYAGQWDKVWIRDVSDHAPINYLRAVQYEAAAA
jgi:predicted lipase